MKEKRLKEGPVGMTGILGVPSKLGYSNLLEG